MKIIHTGDIHLGIHLHDLPREKAKLRQAEILDGFRRLCTYAKTSSVTAVLLAGDLFEDSEVETSLIQEFLTIIEQAKPTLFFYVTGNHDEKIRLTNTPDNFFRFSQNHAWFSYALGENVTVSGMDFADYTDSNFSALSLSPDTYNIVLLHGNMQGKQGEKETLPTPYLQNKYVDYLALGHIHAPDIECKRLDSRGRFRYCGTLEGKGFDEIGKKGFFLLEIEQGMLVSEKFYTFARREVVEKRVDISACNSYAEIERSVFSALQQENTDNVLRLVLCGSYKEGIRKELPLLTSRLCERFFHVKVVDESRLYINPNAYQNDCTERGEFIRELARYQIDAQLKEEILEVGLKALAGEEIEL